MGFEELLNNPDNITFSILFVGLLVWVIRTNDTREKSYRETIKSLSDSLGTIEDMKATVNEIKDKILGK
ncbi:hypothetical protein LABALGNA3A7_05100 [Dellaglioa algida]|nr:hypothetical protein LABALGNA3A7_05100 [Dellaglioa algida]